MKRPLPAIVGAENEHGILNAKRTSLPTKAMATAAGTLAVDAIELPGARIVSAPDNAQSTGTRLST
ncbi:MAG: hypothetical protein PVG24_05725 [Gammaproteobacteria bacterium]|jgi:hypothetical protein